MNLSHRISKLENLQMSDKGHHRQFTDTELAARIAYLLDQAKRVEETGIKPEGWDALSAAISRINKIMDEAASRDSQTT